MLKSNPKILICDDEQNIHLSIKSSFEKEYIFKSAYRSDEALVILKNNQIDLVLLDINVEHERSGLALIPKIKALNEEIKIVVFSGLNNFDTVKNAILNGASDYIIKDANPDELKHVLAKTLLQQQTERLNQQQQFELKKHHSANSLIGESEAIQKVRKQIEKARNSPASILISGETGCGKEVIARALRKTNPDGSLEPFIAVDSSTIQSSVAESILFGFEKGAFTGADKTTRGLFEEANGGTIYFDELANMPLDIQNKLLRVVQEKEVMKMGSSKPISLDFRVICATNQNLEDLVSKGKFKDDLYQRLCVLQIEAPSIRDRIDDVPLLLNYFSEKLRGNLNPLHFLPETLEVLKSYSWPGNVREIHNLVLYLYTMMDQENVSPLDLPPKFLKNLGTTSSANRAHQNRQSFYEAVEDFEKKFLEKHYSDFEGNVSKMAATLEMDRSYLHGKLKGFGIHSSKKVK